MCSTLRRSKRQLENASADECQQPASHEIAAVNDDVLRKSDRSDGYESRPDNRVGGKSATGPVAYGAQKTDSDIPRYHRADTERTQQPIGRSPPVQERHTHPMEIYRSTVGPPADEANTLTESISPSRVVHDSSSNIADTVQQIDGTTIRSFGAAKLKPAESSYDTRIIRIDAYRRRNPKPIYKVYFRDQKKAAWITADTIPPDVLSKFYVENFQKKQKKRYLRRF